MLVHRAHGASETFLVAVKRARDVTTFLRRDDVAEIVEQWLREGDVLHRDRIFVGKEEWVVVRARCERVWAAVCRGGGGEEEAESEKKDGGEDDDNVDFDDDW